MRTLISTLLVGISLVASPAMAQQHPWVPSGEPVGSLPNGDLPAARNPWVPSNVYAGSLPNGDVARADSRSYGGATGSRHHSPQAGK